VSVSLYSDPGSRVQRRLSIDCSLSGMQSSLLYHFVGSNFGARYKVQYGWLVRSAEGARMLNSGNLGNVIKLNGSMFRESFQY
jgi:hypothetical protein